MHLILLLFLGVTLLSCESDNDSDTFLSSIDFKKAQLFAFPLSEVEGIGIKETSIEQPTFINGVPQGKGQINVVLSNTSISSFSLSEVPFDATEFTISPSVGEQRIIPGQVITYTISAENSPVLLQYDVLITIEDLNPSEESLSLDTFSFLTANNPDLENDIQAQEIRNVSFPSPNKPHGTIVVIVPRGTNFSDLKPTIEYSGSAITYHTELNGADEDFKSFTNGTSIDFKYPNLVQFKIFNSDQSRYKKYHVIVDVKDPISWDKTDDIFINDGNVVSRVNIFNNVTTFTNVGNYPIKFSIPATNVTVIDSPEENPINYYTSMILRNSSNDNDISPGEKGRLFVKTNFPGNFVGDFAGISTYIVEASFDFSTNGFRIGPIQTVENEGEFKIYDTAKIQIHANVFVLDE